MARHLRQRFHNVVDLGCDLEALTGRRGPELLMQALDVAVGAASSDNVVVQVILSVISTAMLGNSLQAMRHSCAEMMGECRLGPRDSEPPRNAVPATSPVPAV